MPKIYLLGGENVFLRSAREINLAALEDAGSRVKVLVFPWARASFDNNYRKRKLFSDYLHALGAGEVNFAEYGEQENISQKLAWADMVYLTGGQASILIERTKKMGLDKLLSTFRGVIIGRSAGALALCTRCITTCRVNGKVRVVNGLGLVDITLKVHYTPQKDEALKRFSLKEKIYAVAQGSALVYEKSRLLAIGEAYVLNGGKRQVFVEGNL
jgi:dipeptidase E